MPNWCLVLCICGNVHFTTTVKTHLLWLKFNVISSRLVHWTFSPLPTPQKEKKWLWLLSSWKILIDGYWSKTAPMWRVVPGGDFHVTSGKLKNRFVTRSWRQFQLLESSGLLVTSPCPHYWGRTAHAEARGRQPPCRGPCFACWLWCGTVTSDECALVDAGRVRTALLGGKHPGFPSLITLGKVNLF